MATRVSKERITREPGYLYYLGKDGYVWANPMRGKGGRKHKVGTEMIVRQPGLYFVDKAGYVSFVPRKGAGKKKKMTATVTKFNVKIGGGKTVKSKLLTKAYKKL
jgi:hypothetical protein